MSASMEIWKRRKARLTIEAYTRRSNWEIHYSKRIRSMRCTLRLHRVCYYDAAAARSIPRVVSMRYCLRKGAAR